MNQSRDTTIDGFRALAALGVVFSHAIDFRFGKAGFPGYVYVEKIAGSLASTSVQVFFVISGFIITTLLLSEERKRGRISIRGFYIRRACRILPPLIFYFVTLLTLRAMGWIALDDASLASSALFTCNLGFVDCTWWTAHTWSLAVEEQFYLLWPLLLILVPHRARLLTAISGSLILAFAIMPLGWHNNYISSACIAFGALYAVSRAVRDSLSELVNLPIWLVVAAGVILCPALLPWKLSQSLAPFLIFYLVFAARELPLVERTFSWKPIQWIALGSYSLYIWQQLFLAEPSLYLGPVLPAWLLPLPVILSVILIEQPFIKLGRKLSKPVTTGPTGLASHDLGAPLPTATD